MQGRKENYVKSGKIYRRDIGLSISQLIKKTLTGLWIISKWSIVGNGRRLAVFRGKLYNPITACDSNSGSQICKGRQSENGRICQHDSQSAGLFNSIKILIKFKHRPRPCHDECKLWFAYATGAHGTHSQSDECTSADFGRGLRFAIIDTRTRTHTHVHVYGIMRFHCRAVILGKFTLIPE